jgi:hypothetical protein
MPAPIPARLLVQARYFCPSCHQKRVLAYGEWVETSVLSPVPHRQYVFTVPRLLRPIFSRKRSLLGRLCQIAERLLSAAYAEVRPGKRPGLILFVQTFGDLVTFNLHIHVLAADGVFDDEGMFTVLPAIPCRLLERRFRTEVLALLIRERAVTEQLVAKICSWRHTGFSVHNAVRVKASDTTGRQKLAEYMLRAPFSLEKMTYDARTGMVIYRSHLHKTLKRNFQLMQGAQWLELLCRHIPDRFEHLVRYAGWYSNCCRGKRAHNGVAQVIATASRDDCETAGVQARSTWARLIP